MKKQDIYFTDYEIMALILFFISGTSSLLVRGLEAGKDAWMACILATVFAMFMCGIYVAINNFYPGYGLYDVILKIFGTIIGKVIVTSYVLYTGLTVVLVLRGLGDFVKISILNSTPLYFLMGTVTILNILVLKDSVANLAGWSRIFIIALIVMFLLYLFSIINSLELINIMPLFSATPKQMFDGTLDVFVFPLGETILFMTFLVSTSNKKESYRRFLKPIFYGGMLITVISAVNLLVLGIDIVSSSYYPTLAVLRISELGLLLKRLEILIALIFVMGTFVKLTVYLYALAKGVEVVLGLSDYRHILVPLGILTIQLSMIMFDNVAEFYSWDAVTWIYIGVLFQMIIPSFIFIVGLIRKGTDALFDTKKQKNLK